MNAKRLRLKIMLMLLACALFSSTVFSQDILVKGRVTTGESATPLAGVSILQKGTKNGTTTSASGEFSITVPRNATLTFSSVGFNDREVKVDGRTEIAIKLETGSSELSSVVVVGYGAAKKTTLTGSVSSIKGKALTEAPVTNVSNSLVGRLPGLVAVQGSGEPGYDGSTLRIRGSNTLNNNAPLIVVDGVPGRSLERIDPNSVESVTILKDASAAIYGSQAGNGVILVTTKRGKLGKPEITVNLNFGYNQPTRFPEMADAATYATMLNEIAEYRGGAPVYTPDQIQKYSDGSDPWRYPNTDWFKATLKDKSAQNAYNINISGGSDYLKYFVALGARTQEGNYYNSATHYNQYDFRTNLDGKISEAVSIGVDVAGRMEDRNYPTRGAGAIFRMVQRGKPNFPAYWPNGLPGPDIEYGDNPVVVSTDATGYDKDKYYVLNTNLKLNISIPWVRGLSVSGNASIDKGYDFRKTWYTPWYLYTWDGVTVDANGEPVLVKGKRGFDDARLNEYSRDELFTQLYGLINYETTIAKDHDVRVLVGAERRKGETDYFNAFRRFYASTAIDQLFAGGNAEINNGGSGSVSARMSYFGRVNYSYKDKYLAEFVWRYDGSYIFPEANRFGFFPAFSAGWRISEESFWQENIDFINNFKLRASWGQTGNDRIPEWQYLGTYAYGNIIGSPFLPFVTNGNVENLGLYETRIPNPNATWEVVNQLDVGFDASFLNNRLSLEFDYFSYNRDQILWKNTGVVPASAGLDLPYENYGEVSNKGYDFMLTFKDRAGQFDYSVSFNGGHQKNEILKWNERANKPSYQTAIGHPMPSNPDPNNPDAGEYYQAIGIFHTQDDLNKYPHISGARTGDIIFQDVNGDGVIDDNDKVRSYKSNIPTFTGGLNITLGYKGFDLSLLVQGATGAQNYIDTESGEIGNFLQSFAADRWTTANPNAAGPRTFNRDNEYWANLPNTWWLKNTDYIRLKSLQIGYTLPGQLMKKAGMKSTRVFFSGYNLLTYSPDYKDFDPELTAGSGQGYPLQRVLSLGLSATF